MAAAVMNEILKRVEAAKYYANILDCNLTWITKNKRL